MRQAPRNTAGRRVVVFRQGRKIFARKVVEFTAAEAQCNGTHVLARKAPSYGASSNRGTCWCLLTNSSPHFAFAGQISNCKAFVPVRIAQEANLIRTANPYALCSLTDTLPSLDADSRGALRAALANVRISSCTNSRAPQPLSTVRPTRQQNPTVPPAGPPLALSCQCTSLKPLNTLRVTEQRFASTARLNSGALGWLDNMVKTRCPDKMRQKWFGRNGCRQGNAVFPR